MRLFGKQKSRQPSQQPMSLGIPTQIAIGALGMSAHLDRDVGPRDGDNSRSPSFTVRDDSEVQRPRPSGASTSIRGPGDGVTSAHGLREPKVPSDSQKEHLSHIAADLFTSGVRNQKEQGTVANPPEAPAERTSEGDPVGKDAHYTADPGGSEGAERGGGDGTISATVPADEEAARALRAALEVVSANYREIAAIRNKTEDLLSRVVELEEQFNSRPDDVKELNLRSEVIRKFKDIWGRLKLLSEKPEPQRLGDPIRDHGQVSELLEDLRETIFDYQAARQLEIYEQRRNLINPEDATVLNKFHRAQEAEYRHGDRKGCLKGTRQAVLDGVEQWARDFTKFPVYWLNGLAGTGKSTIAQTIAERVFADGRLGASFFCSRDFEDRRNLKLIFPTIAVQLARNYTEFRSVFVPLARSDPEIAQLSLFNQLDRLIMLPLEKSGISAVIIIDALDECEDDEPASAILSVIGRLISKVTRVKFLLTGRPEPRLRKGFRLPLLVEITDMFVLHEVESNQVDGDIRLFFEHSFSELAPQDNWPTKVQLDHLCERAAGLFVIAVATVKFVSRLNNDPRIQLNYLLQSPDSTVHEGKTRLNPKATVDSLYMTILQKAFCDEYTEENPKTHAVLGAVVHAVNPLSPSSIATLLGFEVWDVTPILSSVHSLLILHEDVNLPVKSFHKSFPDFITNPTRCTNPRFYIPPSYHLELLMSCLELMNQTLEKDICHLPEGVKNSEVEDLKGKTEKYISHGLQYACRSWHKHLVSEPTANRHEITSALHCFLEKKFLCWLEVLSVLGTARNAVDALQVAAKWLEKSPTLDLVNDCFRFVNRFFEVINISAPHIYQSALLLCPKDSIVQRLYGPPAKPVARVIQGVSASWDPAIATKRFPSNIIAAAWSPCSRLIAIAHYQSSAVIVLDAVTFEQLHTMHPPQKEIKWGNITFSPGTHLLTAYSQYQDCIITWDLQTGSLLSNISTQGYHRCDSVTYSGCETIVGGSFSNHTIIIYNVLSGMHISSHPIQQSIYKTVWTSGEYLQFATVESESITVWQVSFTSNSPPTTVCSLPTPEDFSSEELVLLPALSRLALAHNDKVLIWDAQNQKVLLDSVGVVDPRAMSFSPDGHFFVCGSKSNKVHIWKESLTNYLLHQELESGGYRTIPLVSPNREFVSSFSDNLLQLWHITGSPTCFPNISIENSVDYRWPFVEFSPDKSLVAVTKWLSSTVTVTDMKSGDLWLSINTGTETCGLRMTEDKIIVVGDEEIITWDLPTTNYTVNTRRDINDSVQTTTFKCPTPVEDLIASISPCLKYVAIWGVQQPQHVLCIYSMYTGEELAATGTRLELPEFFPNSNKVWCAGIAGEVNEWEIIEDGSNTKLEQLSEEIHPLSGFPWHSSNGHQIIDNGWILSSSGKWLLWLPHHLQPEWEIQKKWSGNYLAVWNIHSLEPCILEIDG